MSKTKARQQAESNDAESNGKKTRLLSDYVFEEHHEDKTVTSLGLTLHYPSEAAIVRDWLESKRDQLGIEGVIRVCQKKYHND